MQPSKETLKYLVERDYDLLMHIHRVGHYAAVNGVAARHNLTGPQVQNLLKIRRNSRDSSQPNEGTNTEEEHRRRKRRT